jgi:F-type H+-transporting ATPase subunit epsilon
VATPFHAELVTPEKVLFSGDVEEVSMRTDEGEISFLAAHEDYVAAVDITVVRLSVVDGGAHSGGGAGPGARHEGSGAPPEDGAPGGLRAAVHGGFVQVDLSGVVILASVAELADEIDVERARRALEAASQALTEAPGATSPAGGHAASQSSSADEHGGAEQASVGGPALPGGTALLAAPSPITPSPAMLALLEPDAPEVRVRRAQARLEAAGVA